MSPIKRRISISLSPDLVKGLDKKIDNIHIRSRSHAIETILSKTLGLYIVKNAVILVGGKEAGKMLSAADEALAEITKTPISSVVLITGMLAPSFGDKIAKYEDKGVNIVLGKSSSGSAGALRDNRNILPQNEPFLVVNTLKWPKRIAVENLFQFHKYSNMVATVFRTNLNSGGIYVFEPDIIRYIPEKGFAMLEQDVFPYLEENNLLIHYKE